MPTAWPVATARTTPRWAPARFAASLAAVLACASGLGVPGAMPSAHAADAARAKAKADQVCAACHGRDGNTPIDPTYPRLAGQHEDYLRRALLDYRSDARKNPIMSAQAKQLTPAEIDDLAAYYASLPGQLTVRK